MDSYKELRELPLGSVLSHFGFNSFRKRPKKEEFYGKCPVHESASNSTPFSFTAEKFNCFSQKCGIKGSGAIDLVMALKSVGFAEATTLLEAVPRPEVAQSPFKGSYEKYYVESAWLSEQFPKCILESYGVGLYDNPARKSAYTGHYMMPVRQFSDGEKVGYVAFTLSQDGKPQYVPTRQLHGLYGSFEAKEIVAANQGRVLRLGLVVTNPLDVLRARQAGVYAVCPLASPAYAEILPQLFRGVLILNPAPVPELSELAQRMWVRQLQVDSQTLSLEALEKTIH